MYIQTLLIVGLMFTGLSRPSMAVELEMNKTFTIGLISSKPKKRIKDTTPLLEYIVEQLPEYNKGKVFVTDSITEMSSMLESGQVSMVATTLYAALLIEQKSKASIAALQWKQGVDSYHSIIFTRKNSGIDDINDLLGRTIAFEKYSSTSAFFMPSIYLLENGFSLQKVQSMKEKPDPNKIGYFFMSDYLRKSSEINMSLWVFHGRLDAAAFSNLDWADSNSTPEKAKEKLKIIAKTEPFTRGLLLTSSKLSKKTEQSLLTILFNAEHNDKGVAALTRFKETKRFSSITEPILELLEQGRKHLMANPEYYQ